jgi:hypothetical protein
MMMAIDDPPRGIHNLFGLAAVFGIVRLNYVACLAHRHPSLLFTPSLGSTGGTLTFFGPIDWALA